MLDDSSSGQAGQERSERAQECDQSTSHGQSCCSSGSHGIPQKWRAIIFFVVLAAAGIVLANSLMRKSKSTVEQSRHSFPEIAASETTSKPPAATSEGTGDQGEPALWGPELNSLAALDEVATDVDAVFVLIGGRDQQDAGAIIGEIEAATGKIRSRGNRASAFKLKDGTAEYESLAEQFSVPTVLAMIKGLGYSAVSEEITETNLLEAFVRASRAPSACCPPGTDPSQCGPRGCGPSGCSLSDSK